MTPEEKVIRLRQVLRRIVAELENEEIRNHFPFTSRHISAIAQKGLRETEDAQ